MGAQRFPSPAETGFKKAVDRVTVVWSLVTSHTGRITHGKSPEKGGHFAPTKGMAQVGLYLLAEAAWRGFVTGRAGKLTVACVHGYFSMKPFPNGQHSKRRESESQTEADQIGAVLPFSRASSFHPRSHDLKLRVRNY